MTLRVQDQSPEVMAMAQHWQIVDALLGGTSAMRASAKTFMPKWPNEEQAAYDARLATATLFPAFRRTLNVMAGKPFARQLVLGEDVPPDIAQWLDDVDRNGNSLHVFAGEAFREAMAYGLAGVLVEMPETGGANRTKEDDKRLGVRPYFVLVQHQQILGWQSETVNGRWRLTQLRVAENAKKPDGPYGSTTVNRVRVYTPGAWELWEQGKDGYALIGEGVNTLNAIPFVPIYGEKRDNMKGVSPLLDLAFLNVKHWQSQSDQDTILHVARVPILAMMGAEEGAGLTVGASSAVKLPQGGDLKFVEHSGAAIGAGATSLTALEEQMIQTGAELLVKTPGSRTATESSNDAEANKSELLRAVERFEDSLDQALQLMANWIKAPTGGHVSLYKDFGAATLSEASAQLILSMQQGGLLSKATALKEQQRRGIIDAGIDPALELEAVASEGPALGTMNDGNGE